MDNNQEIVMQERHNGVVLAKWP